MAIATYKDLCIDANDARLMGAFWAGVLGLELHEREGGQVYLTGATEGHTVWINQVQEPKTVKNRVHLDVNTTSVKRIVQLGGRVLDGDSFRWTLMADPEGGELCAFVREGVVTQRLYELGVDAGTTVEEAHELASWWGRVLDAPVERDEGEGFSWVESIPGAPYDGIVFVPVPEPKVVKNRVHLDVTTTSVEDLVEAGATVLRARDEEIAWTVMADPAGNEFCAFTG